MGAENAQPRRNLLTQRLAFFFFNQSAWHRCRISAADVLPSEATESTRHRFQSRDTLSRPGMSLTRPKSVRLGAS